MENKKCYKCKNIFPLSNFRASNMSYCKPCAKLIDKNKYRSKHLRITYGITEEHYNEMIIKQNGKCAICGSLVADKIRNRLAIDHNHATNEIRGLLCSRCNKVLGLINDDSDIAIKMIDYLRQH